MAINPDDIIGNFEQRKRAVGSLNLEDDIFFNVVMKDLKVCGYLLSVLLNEKITVVENRTQFEIRNLLGRGARLDLLARDEKNRFFNVEMQMSDEHNLERRMRENQALMDCGFLEKGGDVNDLPETYCIFITRFNQFHDDKIVHPIYQNIGGDPTRPYDDGTHKIYFNTAVKNNSLLSDMLQYIRNSTPGCNKFGALSQAVNYYKTTTKGVDVMSENMKELIMIGEERGIKLGEERGIKLGEERGIKLGEERGIKLGEERGIKLGEERGIKLGEERGKRRGALMAKAEIVDAMLESGIAFDKALNIVKLEREAYEEYKRNH